jgi:integrase
MARIKLRFVQGFVAHGKPYYYFRKPGCARIALPGSPFSEEFMTTYRMALAADAPPSDIGARRNAPGTVAALVAAYASWDRFRDLAAETRRTRWPILRRFADEHGDKRVALLKREHVEAMLRSKRPNPRQNFLKVLRPLLKFAVSIGWCSSDPTCELRADVKRGPGFRPWGEEQIAAFRHRHPLGSRARLAIELLLGTAQRRGDVVGMGPQHVRREAIEDRHRATDSDPARAAGRARCNALRASHVPGDGVWQALHCGGLHQLVPRPLQRGGPARI